jgi:hypothetical protein
MGFQNNEKILISENKEKNKIEKLKSMVKQLSNTNLNDYQQSMKEIRSSQKNIIVST